MLVLSWARRPAWLVSLLVLGSVTRIASAQGVDEASRSAARDLGYEGIELLEKGNATGATERLERAYQVLRVPTIGLWSARALVATGKLVEASERYLEVARLTSSGDVAVQDAAKADAARERDALLPRIPGLVVRVDGGASGQRVLLDGVEIPAALLGVQRPVNPGSHQLVLSPGAAAPTNLTIKEGELKSIVLSATAAPAAAGSAVPPSLEPSAAPSDRARDAGATRRTVGWVLLGVGGVGLVTGGVAAGLALGKKSSISAYCNDDNACLPEAHDRVDDYDTLRTVSSVGFIAGVVSAGVGLTLVLTAPRQQAPVALRLRGGFGSIALEGAL